MNQRRFGINELTEPIEHAEVRRRKDINYSASLDERRGLCRCDVVLEHAESAGPPVALEVQVCAVRQQHVQHREILPGAHHRPAVEVIDWSICRGADLRVTGEQLTDALHLPGVEGSKKLFLKGHPGGIIP